ncbi:unnamed protein product [Rhizopus stolonifer]
MSTENKIPSEEILAQKWDCTISNFVVKTGLGISIGIVASALLFKSKYKINLDFFKKKNISLYRA